MGSSVVRLFTHSLTGLNVEQRKRLTIGVELAAKPELLLFLDEPTSGLDSQTSWSILKLLRKLRDNGQAILCTIHQPSAMLFQQFDTLLLLAEGGRTVYFGPVGASASTLLEYFERNGGLPCPVDSNPAEYMLEVIGAAPGSHTNIDWPEVWRQSPERTAVRAQLEEWKDVLPNQQPPLLPQENISYTEFAASLPLQLLQTLIRIFQQYWRTPGYIYAKISLVGGTVCVPSSLKLLLSSNVLYTRASLLASRFTTKSTHSVACKTKCSACSCLQSISPCWPSK